MKYLATILGIILLLTIATLAIIWPEKQPAKEDIVMTVNDYTFTSAMLAQSEKQRSSHHESWKDFLDSIAIEQVLIQEAQRQKIDREPAFRQSIKNYYEQSLVKILLDRQNHVIDAGVSEQEIDSFLSYSGRTITFTIAQGEGTTTPEVDWSNGKTSTELFDNLSSTLQPVLAGLKPGNTRAVYDTGNEWYAARVDDVSGSPSSDTASIPRETIRSIIENHKREQQLNQWISRLITDADISITDKKEEN